MTYAQAVEAGNKFVSLSVTILLLVQYLILSVSDRQRDVNQRVGAAANLIEIRTAVVQQEIRRLNDDASRRERTKSEADRRQDSIKKALADLTDLQKARLDLESKRIVQQLKIPGTELAFDGSDVKLLYPLSLMVGLLLLLFHRHRVLQSPRTDADGLLPFWATPIPWRDYSGGRVAWLVINVGGWILILYVVQLAWRFAHRDEFFASPYLASLVVASAIVVVISYGLATVSACLAGAEKTPESRL
jgi:hypothetical protein